MYASQTKRLCVREAPTSDDNRAQHHSTSSTEAASTETNHQHSSTSTSSSSQTLVAPTNLHPTDQRPVGANPGATNANRVGGQATRTDINMTASAAETKANNENESPLRSSTSPIASVTQNTQQQHDCEHSSIAENNKTSSTSSSSDTEDGNTEQELVQRLATETLEETKLDLILAIRNLITACNKKKVSLVKNPNFAKILRIIDDEKQTSTHVKAQLALLLCSIAKGGEQNVKILNDSFVDDKIFNLILHAQDDVLIEACLRCLRAIMSWPNVSRAWMLYDKFPNQNHNNNSHQQQQSPQKQQLSNSNSNDDNNSGDNNNLIGPQRIIKYAEGSKSHIVQECVADIFATTCCRNKDQTSLHKSGAIPCVVQLLDSPSSKVTIAALNWLSAMCLRNKEVSLDAMQSQCPKSGLMLLEKLVTMMNKDECHEFQFLSAKCYAKIYRALEPEKVREDPRIVTHVLPTLVRMVHKDKPSQLRAEAAECIAYLIDNDTKLQSTASICDHLIESLADMLEYENSILSDLRDYSSQLMSYRHSRDKDIHWMASIPNQKAHQPQVLDLRNFGLSRSSDFMGDICSSESNQEMRRSAFLALAALASNLEVVRKRIYDTCSVMQHLVRGLTDNDPKTLKSVLTCLLSLSRSVQQLRTSFAENSVYSALKNLLGTSSNDVLILVLAILCNISLDFSSGKHHFLDTTTIMTLCNLTKGTDPFLRLHAMWILMNMVYQLKDTELKFQILRTLGTNHVLNILMNENNEMELVLKTLGFLRNLLSQRNHIDEIMSNHGSSIIKALMKVLERCPSRVKEQALCVLTNIADGMEAKAFIMNDRNVLNYLLQIISDNDAGDMRLAAICCITNLAHKDQEGFQARQNELKKYGLQERLKSLLNTDDPVLSDRVRTAYNQFLLGIDDKYVN